LVWKSFHPRNFLAHLGKKRDWRLLIQTRPQRFRLDGSDKLRFFTDLEETEDRVEKVRELLGMLH